MRATATLAHRAEWEKQQVYDTAIRLQPDDSLALNNRGILRKEQGDPEGAQKDFDTARRLSSDLQDDYARILWSKLGKSVQHQR